MSSAPASESEGVRQPAAVERAQTAAVVPPPPQTGDDEVDHATVFVATGAAAESTLPEQLAIYEAAHRILQARLADVEG